MGWLRTVNVHGDHKVKIVPQCVYQRGNYDLQEFGFVDRYSKTIQMICVHGRNDPLLSHRGK
jgi:hypothetical protein